MRDLLVLATVLGVVGISSAMRAFPIDSIQKAEREFQSINPRIVWDETNYLVDVSGRYAHCKYLYQDGTFEVDPMFEKNDETIGGLRSTEVGGEAHWEAVNNYIAAAMEKWVKDPRFIPQISNANKFGCSVQPRCRDRGGLQVSIACVFSPSSKFGQGEEPLQPKALAFTPQQYVLAEHVVGIGWDRTFYLENLSGTETDCAMVEQRSYSFPVAAAENEKNKYYYPNDYEHISGIFGSSPNLGDTEQAMVRILDDWAKAEGKKLEELRKVQVGCSIIPDCKYGGQMYVVVSCLYSSP